MDVTASARDERVLGQVATRRRESPRRREARSGRRAGSRQSQPAPSPRSRRQARAETGRGRETAGACRAPSVESPRSSTHRRRRRQPGPPTRAGTRSGARRQAGRGRQLPATTVGACAARRDRWAVEPDAEAQVLSAHPWQAGARFQTDASRASSLLRVIDRLTVKPEVRRLPEGVRTEPPRQRPSSTGTRARSRPPNQLVTSPQRGGCKPSAHT